MCVLTESIFVDNYLPALLAQASQIISTEFHQVVQQNGLSITEWRVLSTLSGAGVVSVGHLARIATSKQPTVTRVVDKMVQAGYVHRVAHNGDRRVTLVEITPIGGTLISELIIEAKKHEDEVVKRLQPLDVQALKSTLRRLIAESSTED